MDKLQLIQYLGQFATDERRELFHRIANERTRYLTVVLEDIYQSQNASAVLRTCDCFGIQDIHIVENQNKFQINPDVTLGSDKWLNLHLYQEKTNNTAEALSKLKKAGYRIVATTPHTQGVTLENFDIKKGKAALVFGGELRGLSNEALEMADEFLKIPMFGFTESLNISVSAAIILQQLTSRLRHDEIFNWKLPETEKQELILNWLKTSIKDSERILKHKFGQNIILK